jgi:hypothetical protein
MWPGSDRCVGEVEFRKALEMMELAAETIEHMKKVERKELAREDFEKTLEKLWPLTSNEKPS